MRQKLEPSYSFMIRVRVPGGIATPAQWLALDELAQEYGNKTMRLTSRQAFQFHGVAKGNLKNTIHGINESLLDTIAACGDVNRNVMCSPIAGQSAIHRAAYDTATAISEHLTPQTRAYHEIWLDGEKVVGTADAEPIYGATYLPRKFKIAVAIPPSNDVDIFSQDLGFIAIEKNGELIGFNITAGGGMGMTHGEAKTYPRVADVVGFCTVDQAVEVAEHVVGLQRDYGDRSDRKHARLKYTIDDRGQDWFREELFSRLGYALTEPKKFAFVSRGDQFGWSRNLDGRWDLTVFVPQGRIQNNDESRMLTGLREVARIHKGDFRLTPNQNLIISGIDPSARQTIERLFDYYGVAGLQQVSPLRQQALACVALPTCALAMAEAERYLPELNEKIEALLGKHGLIDEAITLRITGCPNGCARPYLAEIGLVGKAPGRYNLFLGGSPDGRRLNRLVHENLDEARILEILDGLLEQFAAARRDQESFGDFAHRAYAPRAEAS
jgi:sulfite reductase (NADPH) hemoprotein beta-component